MKCQWCGKEFPTRKGRFCGTCKSPQQLALQHAQEELASKQTFADAAVRVAAMWEDKCNRLEAERDQYKTCLIRLRDDHTAPPLHQAAWDFIDTALKYPS